MDSLRRLFGYFLAPVGLGIFAALDSSLIFFLPFGVDGLIIALASRNPNRFWLYPVVATVGSLTGAAFTYGVGRLIGARGLAKVVSARRLKRIERKLGTRLLVTTAVAAIIPPPFPFTAFVLAAGALRVSAARFFGALA